jgi:hypothetical protein
VDVFLAGGHHGFHPCVAVVDGGCLVDVLVVAADGDKQSRVAHPFVEDVEPSRVQGNLLQAEVVSELFPATDPCFFVLG